MGCHRQPAAAAGPRWVRFRRHVRRLRAVARRRRMDPRLSMDGLGCRVGVGGRHDAGGWRWEREPMLRFGGFGPWRPEWAMARLPGLSMPVLGAVGLQNEPMGWGTLPEDVEPW